MSPLPQGARIAVAGAGIIGVCAAVELAEAGYQVTLIDQAGPGDYGPSRGNAGHIAAPEILPLAYPGILRDGLKMWLDPNGPLKIPVRNWPEVAPWLYRFWRSSAPEAHQASIRALAWLNAQVAEATDDLYRRAGIYGKIHKEGAITLYESRESFERARAGWDLKRQQGHPAEIIEPEDLAVREPGLAKCFHKGVLAPGWWSVSDPHHIVQDLAHYGATRGVVFQQARLANITPEADRVQLQCGDRLPESFDAVVLACGVWTRDFARRLGESLPLTCERGYNATIPEPGFTLRHSLLFADRGFVATRLQTGLRIGGWTELGGPDQPPNHDRTQRILAQARDLFPGLKTAGGRFWMGPRPSLPDSVPLIGASGRSSRVIYACGHGHLGLTQAPVTGRLVRDLIRGTAAAEMRYYGLERFSGGSLT